MVSYGGSYKKSPGVSNRFDPDAWMPLLSQCARPPRKPPTPPEPSRPHGSLLQHKDDFDHIHTLMGHLWNARKTTGISLLAHMGFHHRQWSTVYAFLSEFVDTYELLMPYMAVFDLGPGLDWHGTGMTLDQLTSASWTIKAKDKPTGLAPLPLPILTLRPAFNNFGHRILADLLQNVGSVILTAADHSLEESKLAMSCVFRILARLHKLGLISDKVYQFSPNDPGLLSCRPPGLHLLSGHIMTVLSDAAWQEHESALRAAATDAGEDPPFLPFQPGVRELGHEIWLELILWCCVEHGFTRHGAGIVKEMTRRRGDQAWTTESWAPLLKSFDLIQQTNVSTEQFWRRPGSLDAPQVFKGHNKPPFHGLGKRTISAEVVACLRSGLFNQAYNGVGHVGTLPKDLLKLSVPLNSLLGSSPARDEIRPTNRMTNWYVNRMLESGSLRPDEDPMAFGRTLQSTEDLVPPWDGDGIGDGPDLRSLTRAQLYDQTAAMVGLVEYNLRYHAKQRRIGPALYQFAWLQNIVDASKVQHIQEFFFGLGQPKSADILFFDDSQRLSPRIRKSSIPQISVVTLADVLDLATGSHAYDFGSWLLFNKDIDGPPIPKTLYGNQALAPSILRFASATQNARLAKQVLGALETPLSVNMIKAVINFHLDMEDWDRVEMMLQHLRDEKWKGWGASNLTSLAAKIIRLHVSVEGMPEEEKVSSNKAISLERAKSIFRQFFRKVFNSAARGNPVLNDFQERLLARASAVFNTVPGPLGPLLREANYSPPPTGSRTRLDYLPGSAFNHFLAAVVDAYGSEQAWRAFVRWCHTMPSPKQRRQKEGGVVRLYQKAERNRLQGAPSFDSEWFHTSQTKAAIFSLTTIRLLAHGALKEFTQAQQNPTSSPSTTDNQSPEPSTPSSPPISHIFLKPGQRYNQPYYLDRPYINPRWVHPEGGQWPSSDAEAVLDHCFCLFLYARLTIDQIECELPGFADRLYQRGILTEQFRHDNPPEELSQLSENPWMKYIFRDHVVPVSTAAPAPAPAEPKPS